SKTISVTLGLYGRMLMHPLPGPVPCPGIITTVIQTAISATIHLYGYRLVVTSSVVIYPLAEVKGNGHVKARFASHIHIRGTGCVISRILRRCARLAVSRSWISY